MNSNCDFERLSLIFVRNLLKNGSGILRMRIDTDDLMIAIADRVDADESSPFLTKLIALTPGDTESIESITELFTRKQGSLPWRVSSALTTRHRAFANVLVEALNGPIEANSGQPVGSFAEALAEVAQALSLDEAEKNALALIFMVEERAGLFEDSLNDDRIWDSKNIARHLAAMIDVSESRARQLVSREGSLFRLGLVTCRGANRRIEVMDRLSQFLNGTGERGEFLETLFEIDSPDKPYYRPPNVTDEDWEIMNALVKERDQLHILLHGVAGTGKSTLVKAVARNLGYRVLNVMSPKDGDQEERISNLRCAAAIAETLPDTLVVVDEADRLLATRHSYLYHGDKTDKGWLNKFLDTGRLRAIWITNEVSGIEPSTIRRFAFKLEFRPYTRRQRQTVWHTVLDETPALRDLLTTEDVADFAGRFALQPAEIADTIRHVAHLGLPEGRIRPMLERCLESHLSMKGRKPIGHIKVGSMAPYGLDGLNTNGNLPAVIDAVKRFFESDQNINGVLPRNLNVLLSGLPGTGKTEFVRYLAQATGLDLVMRTASELKSPYVGVTEKLIADAFREAESDRAILFIDEADSFIWPRESASRSWEVSETNEFLCRMENFKGVLVCATNSLGRVDTAAYRRFAYRLRFDALTPDGCVTFYRRFFGAFGARVEMTAGIEARVRGLRQMTPGDFKAVMQRLTFLPEGEIGAERLVKELEEESRFKAENGGGGGKEIGFRG